MNEKTCAICKECKTVEDFCLNKQAKDGRETRCKVCCAKKTRDWYQKNRERALAGNRERRNNSPEETRNCRNRWIAANKEKSLAIKKRYRERHKEALALDQKKRIAANPEKRRATLAKWGAANIHKLRASVILRRAKKIKATTNWDSELDSLVLTEAVLLAIARKAATAIPWDVDHIEPVRGRNVCGLHNAYNIAVVPRIYNQRKSNRQNYPHWLDQAFAQ